ncbi:HIRAN domain-containing protein [Alphaproteobacteria bacterium US3C007]|nr:HIRAN domain-containing protein [Alphaproteobacteria bacterium US3C007]
MSIFNWLFGKKDSSPSDDFDAQQIIKEGNKEAWKMFHDFEKANKEGNSKEVQQRYIDKHGLTEQDLNSEGSLSSPKYHGAGKRTSADGHDYEAFRLNNDIKERKSYKIDEYFEVQGSFNFKREVNFVCDWLAKAGENVVVEAILEREPNNPHDRNAIKILISGNTLTPTMVGYLPKEISAKIGDQLPPVEFESIYQRRKIEARTLIKRPKAKKK